MNQRETVGVAARTSLHTFLLCCGLINSVFVVISYLILGAISPGYDMMRQSIGDLQFTSHGWMISVIFIIVGLLNCAFAAGLRKELRSGFGATLIPLFYVLVGLGLFAIAIWKRGAVYEIASVVVFSSIVISFFLLARRFAGDPRWKGWSNFTILCTVLMLLLLVVYSYTKSIGGEYAGLFERLSIVVRMIWAIPFIMTLLDGRRLTQEGL